MQQDPQSAAPCICCRATLSLNVLDAYDPLVRRRSRHKVSAWRVVLSAMHMTRTVSNNCCVQAYGMMGWRVGYIAYPSAPGGGGDGFLGAQLLKVQDTIPVCPPQLSQVLLTFRLVI